MPGQVVQTLASVRVLERPSSLEPARAPEPQVQLDPHAVAAFDQEWKAAVQVRLGLHHALLPYPPQGGTTGTGTGARSVVLWSCQQSSHQSRQALFLVWALEHNSPF